MSAAARARLRAEAEAHADRLGRPYVVLKIAASLDGRTATRTGESQWITSPEARARGRQLRGALDAIAVGAETVLADDPSLTTRIRGAPNPLRVVFDSTLRIPPGAALVQTAADVSTLVLTTRRSAPADRARLEGAGAEVQLVKQTRQGRVHVEAALAALHARGVRGLLVEGGATLAGAFLDAGLVDRVYAFIAPVLIGGEGARSALGGHGAGPLADALRLEVERVQRVGDDVLLIGAPRR